MLCWPMPQNSALDLLALLAKESQSYVVSQPLTDAHLILLEYCISSYVRLNPRS